MTKLIISIDPGLSGAIAVIQTQQGSAGNITVTSIPWKGKLGNVPIVDNERLLAFLPIAKNAQVFIAAEHVSGYNQGTVGAFSFGGSAAAIVNLIAAAYPLAKLSSIPPRVWQAYHRNYFSGGATSSNPKESSREWFRKYLAAGWNTWMWREGKLQRVSKTTRIISTVGNEKSITQDEVEAILIGLQHYGEYFGLRDKDQNLVGGLL